MRTLQPPESTALDPFTPPFIHHCRLIPSAFLFNSFKKTSLLTKYISQPGGNDLTNGQFVDKLPRYKIVDMDSVKAAEGGFVFDNVARNAMLEQTGLKVPKGVSTGTTICGIIYKDGVILGADTRATEVLRTNVAHIFNFSTFFSERVCCVLFVMVWQLCLLRCSAPPFAVEACL